MLAAILALIVTGQAQAELARKERPYPVNQTIERLEAVLKERGLTVFATIDHAAGAKTVNQQLRPTTLIIFGSPAAGTPLIQAEQTMGLSLPLKACSQMGPREHSAKPAQRPKRRTMNCAIATGTPSACTTPRNTEEPMATRVEP